MQLPESSAHKFFLSEPAVDLSEGRLSGMRMPIDSAEARQNFSSLFFHKKSLTERPSDYPPRFPIPEDKIAWDTPFPKYTPRYCVTPTVLAHERSESNPQGWADPEDFSKVAAKHFFSYVGEVRRDTTTNHPLNPMGRTGITGRGRLGAWGANFAGDALVTRENPHTGSIEIAIITKKNGQKALPGGMLDREEDSFSATLREFREETSGNLAEVQFEFIEKIFEGYVDDPRNTDNAWMETTAYHFHVSRADAHKLVLSAGDDAKAVEWMPFIKGGFSELYASHGVLVERAIECMQRRGTKI